MAKQKRRSYSEPWKAERSPTWKIPYRTGPVVVADVDPSDQRQSVLDWEAKKAKAEQNAPWILWGSNLSTPGACTSLDGKVTVTDDMGIIAVHKRGNWAEGQPTPQEHAQRIAACVNSMADVPDPCAFMDEIRELLADLAKGETDRCDKRIGRLYATCYPMEEEITI